MCLILSRMIALLDRVLLAADFFPLSTLDISFYSVLVCMVSAEESADSFLAFPLYVTVLFSLAAFKILVTTTFVPFNYYGSDHFGLILLMALCALWIWVSVSFPRFG